MDLATQNHLTALRDLLTYRLAELRAEIHAAEQSRRAVPVAEPDEVSDRKDEASRRQEIELDGAQEQRDVDELKDVEAALRRLDAGVYGDCTDCGEAIPMQRLQVQPAAKRCARCQALHETAAHRAGQS
jgi:DnaK suppressor protein